MKFLKKYVIIALLISMVACLFACNDNEDGETLVKEAFATAVANTDNANVKQINSNFDLKFIFYDASGVPCTIHENLALRRINDGQTQYMDGSIKTVELGGYIADLLNMASGSLGELTQEPAFMAMLNFINGIDYVTFRAALHEDSVNVQLERVPATEQPQYNFSDTGAEMLELKGGWFGASYAEFKTFQAESDFKVMREFDLLDTVMMLSLLPADWSKAVDSADAQKVDYNGVEANQYRLALNRDVIIPFVRSTIEQGMLDLFGEDQEFYNELNGYYTRHADKVVDMFTVPDHTVIAYTDASNRLMHTESNWDLKFSINVDEIVAIMREEGVKEEEITEFSSVLTLANTLFFGSSNQLKGEFEFGFKITITEDYAYDNISIDKSTSLFTPYEQTVPGRYTFGITKDDKGEYKYVETNVPSAVAEYKAQKKAEEEAKKAEEEAKKKAEEEAKKENGSTQEGDGTATT